LPESTTHHPPSVSEIVNRRRRPALRIINVVIAFFVILALIVGLCELFGGWAKTDGGHVAVIRNGGPLSNTKIKTVFDPSSGMRFVGFYASQHDYPSSQRFYAIDATGDSKRTGVEVVQVPTADGIEVGTQGTVYFNLNLDHDTLKSFDNAYGTRKFQGNDATYRYAWEGDEGFNSFLDAIVSRVVNNDLRISIGNYRCSDLLPSCALVQNTSTPVDTSKLAGKGNVNLAKVEQTIASSLETDFTSSLGGHYLTNVRFNLSKITLPQNVQDAIDQAQAQYANVSQSQAKVKQAQLDAQANEEKQKGYNACPACSQIDILKALPQGVTVFAPGSGTGLPLTQPAK